MNLHKEATCFKTLGCPDESTFPYSDEIYDKNVFKRLDGGNEQVNYIFKFEILHFN